MSWLRYMTIYSFAKFNPDWKIILTLDNNSMKDSPWISNESTNQDFFAYDGENYLDNLSELDIDIRIWKPKFQDLPIRYYDSITMMGEQGFISRHREEVDQIYSGSSFDFAKHISLNEPTVPTDSSPTHRSNFFKWYTLATEGGIYADMDIIFLSSINPLFESLKSYESGITWDKGYYLIGLMYSQGNNNMFSKIYKAAHYIFRSDVYQSVGQAALLYTIKSDPRIEYTDEDLLQVTNKQEPICFFDPEIIYPVSFENIGDIFSYGGDEKFFNAHPIGLHWFGGCAPGQEYNNKINKENYLDYKCPMSKALEIAMR